jgi:hypothetical protein
MISPVTVDVFVEDRAHEAFLVPLLLRVARDERVDVAARVRSARGGHPRAVDELKLYQEILVRAPGTGPPDLLIVGIDGNCASFSKARRSIEDAAHASLSDRLVVASPDPHVERWYLADPESFRRIVGRRPSLGRKKCVRDHYKRLLARAIREAGHPAPLGGIEFAAELVEGMDLYRAGKADHSLKAFVDELRGHLRRAREGMKRIEQPAE